MSKPETSGSFSAFSKLSIETLSHIASFFDPHVPAEREALKNMARTCKPLMTSAQKFLWSEIEIITRAPIVGLYPRRSRKRNCCHEPEAKIRELYQIIKNNPNIVKPIRRLTFTSFSSSSDLQCQWFNSSRLVEALDRINQNHPLTAVKFKGEIVPWNIGAARSLVTKFWRSHIAQQITSLHLVNMAGVPIAMITNCVRLDHLRLENTELERLSSHNPSHWKRRPPLLQNLVVKGCGSDVLVALSSSPTSGSPSLVDFTRLDSFESDSWHVEDRGGLGVALTLRVAVNVKSLSLKGEYDNHHRAPSLD